MSSFLTQLKLRWRRWRWYLIAGYAVLLLGSHFARWWRPFDIRPVECCSAALNEVDQDRYLARQIRLAYRDYPATGETGLPPMILLHGSPGEGDDFRRLVPSLAGAHRVIVPDLPGFGRSTREIADYSFRAHALYVIELLDRLKLEKAHLVGFSLGGGVVLSLADIAPQRVASITMLSAIGAQEMELLGDYRLNHAVHGLQLALFWALREGLPVTPAAHHANSSVSYSRNFYDSDQRPLRDCMKRYAGPMLIVHGRKDFLVPTGAAIEHHRLVPQSELVLSDFDHFMVFNKPDYLAPILNDFAGRVEAGKAVTRRGADPARQASSQEPFDPKNLPSFIGVSAFVVFMLLAFATLVSEDLTCIAAGVMAAQGRISFILVSLACFVGIFIGDLLLFLAGRWLGRPALRRAPVKWFVKPEDVDRSSDWFSRQGAKVIFASRFLPGARLPTYFAAGALNTSFWKFALYFALACAIWTPILIALSMALGREVIESAFLGNQALFIQALIAALAIYLLVKAAIRLSTARGRRLMLSTWRRMTAWEFWPPYIFYPPVVVYVAWLMIKHRGLTVFTAANPAIPGGGFIGESKAEILRGLGKASDYLARWRLIEASLSHQERIDLARTFLSQHKLDYPVVLKPDVGQRGAGVAIIKSDHELESYLSGASKDILIQEYVPGSEFGVFYYRYPSQDRGRIFAITEKRFPSVFGEGSSTIEKLILSDDRAICMARFLLKLHSGRLSEVPGPGERVQLVELGTHCRGALFLEGEWLKTAELEDSIDRICRGYHGFYFGRFDLRSPEVEDLKRGRNFKIIELNGVTSEATNIYDPKNSLLSAYRVLFKQWSMAFEIGAENRALGTRPAPVLALLRSLVS